MERKSPWYFPPVSSQAGGAVWAKEKRDVAQSQSDPARETRANEMAAESRPLLMSQTKCSRARALGMCVQQERIDEINHKMCLMDFPGRPRAAHRHLDVICRGAVMNR